MRDIIFFTAASVCGLLLVVLEGALLVKIPSWFGRPDLVFILVMWLALRFDNLRELFLAMLLGLLIDAASGIQNGTYPAAYLATMIIVRVAVSNLNIDRRAHHIPVLVTGYMLFFGIVWLLVSLSGNTVLIPWQQALPEIMAMAVISYPITHLFDRCLAPLDDKELMERFFHGRRRGTPYL